MQNCTVPYDGRRRQDSVIGSWSDQYDSLNRLTTANSATTVTSTQYAGMNLCWAYDAFGNRTMQLLQTTACPTPPITSTPPATVNYNSNNQVTFVSQGQPSTMSAPNGFGYDAAGDVTSDNQNVYLYDAEGRICAVQSTPVPGFTSMTGYLYDASGTRVSKGTITAWNCDPTLSGFTTTNDYVLDLSGKQFAEMGVDANNSVAWQHTNVYAAGTLLATYDGGSTTYGLHFYFNDPLGTRRVQTDYAGTVEQTCFSLPYGDALSCSGSAQYPTEQHFTGKERDTESGNDYFGARYYASSMGRFMSADPSGLLYADPTNPQSMNLYSYALNNPLKNTDPTGMYCYYGDTGGGAQEDADKQDASQWDYHSSQSECTATDENGNQGQWINDDQTHQTADGDWVDNDNRPDNFTLNLNTPSANSNGTNQGASWWPNFTVQVGLSVNLQLWGPLTFTGFTGYLIDSHGHVGEYHGAGGGFSVGAGASAGVQGSVSDGRDICAMGGPFTNLSGTVGGGVGGTVDSFAGYGNAPGGVVTGAGATLGLAGGASGSAMVTGTTIKPFGGHTCVNGEIQ